MNRIRLGIAVWIGATLLAAGICRAADWPQWRGPQRDAKSPETGLLGSWSSDGPPLAWKASGLGSGFASVAVAGDRIYTMGDLGDAQYALGLARKDGSLLWKTEVGPAWKDKYLGPRSTPTVDEDRVYLLSTEGELFCLAAATGKVLWKKDLVAEFGAVMMKAQGTWDWKFSESPLVDGDRVVVTPGSREAALAALDKKTGETLWKTALPELGERGVDGAGYSSSVAAEILGSRQYVQFLGRGVIGVDAASGEFRWGYNRVANDVANIPTPIVHGDHVFTSSGYGTGAGLVRIVEDGDALAAREVYFLEADTMQNHHGGMILHDGHVYSGTGHKLGFPLSVSFGSGSVDWGPVRNQGKGSAAVAYADGRLYFRYEDGLMVLIEATPEEYRERGAFRIPGVSKPSWPHPAIAGGKLYLREQDELLCYDIRESAGTR